MNEYDRDYTEYQLNRSRLRRWVRRMYLGRAVKLLPDGPAIDFGCGIGNLLRRLPPGSIGLEYNAETVAYCRRQGLDVIWYDGTRDGWNLGALPSGKRYVSLVVSHVLEHLDAPDRILKSLLAAAGNRGVSTALLIVPGIAGFNSDPTHRTFIDLPWFRKVLGDIDDWQLTHAGYYPFNHESGGGIFAHNELQVVARRKL